MTNLKQKNIHVDSSFFEFVWLIPEISANFSFLFERSPDSFFPAQSNQGQKICTQ